MAAIIFDFDGTIADSFEMAVQIIGELTGLHKNSLPPEEIERLRGLSLHGAIEELHIKPWKVPFLLMRGRRRMGKQISKISAQPGMPEAIRKLYAEGHQLFLVSSNSENNIRSFLKQHHMSREFIKIYGGAGLLGKVRQLRKIRRHNRLAGDDCWYIGDEVRDIVSAHEAGIRVVAVTWGFNTAKLLESHNPTAMASTPKELLNILENV